MLNGRFYKKICFFVVICLAIAAISTVLCAGTNREKVFGRSRPRVNFFDTYHESHMESFDCIVCHHKYVDGKNVLEDDDIEKGDADILCSSCHNEKSKIDLPTAFHKECIGCHDRLSAQHQATGPNLCGECHVRHKSGTAGLVYGRKNG